MVIFAGEDGASALNQTSVSGVSDPFDVIDAESQNERKHYAIRLGVTRERGQYCFNGTTYADLELAIQSAEAAKKEAKPDDPAGHFLG